MRNGLGVRARPVQSPSGEVWERTVPPPPLASALTLGGFWSQISRLELSPRPCLALRGLGAYCGSVI